VAVELCKTILASPLTLPVPPSLTTNPLRASVQTEYYSHMAHVCKAIKQGEVLTRYCRFSLNDWYSEWQWKCLKQIR